MEDQLTVRLLELQDLVIADLINHLKSGDASPAYHSAAIRLLTAHGVTTAVDTDSAIDQLMVTMAQEVPKVQEYMEEMEEIRNL